jgi:hypothetical protein
VVADCCRDRWCVPCARERARRITSQLVGHVADHPHRFVTLTLKARPEALATSLVRIRTGFARLLRLKQWRACVTGGCAVVELKYRPAAGTWHVHLHALVQGKFLPQRLLSALWRKVTGDSFIVDVRFVRNPTAAVSYVAKYMTKPVESDVLRNARALGEAVEALRGKRLIQTWGSYDRLGLSDAPARDQANWYSFCTLAACIEAAARREAWAITALDVLDGVTPPAADAAYAERNEFLEDVHAPPVQPPPEPFRQTFFEIDPGRSLACFRK